MAITGNNIDNNALAALTKQASPRIANAIKYASRETGVDFAYLMEQAAAESSFDAKAEASTSSATGLYQFIEKTWLHMVRQHGHKYGMADMASKIDVKGNVDDPAIKEEILDLRKDPKKAALLAAEFAAQNKRHLEQYVGGDIGSTELYFAHFMGASGATGFLNAMKEDPMTIGADIFPKEARANHNVFYDRKTGEPRTLSQIYDFFDKKFGSGKSAIDTKATPHHIPNEQQQISAMPSPVPTKGQVAKSYSPSFPLSSFLSGNNEGDAPIKNKTIWSFLQSDFFNSPNHAGFFTSPADFSSNFSSDFLLRHYDALLFAQEK